MINGGFKVYFVAWGSSGKQQPPPKGAEKEAELVYLQTFVSNIEKYQIPKSIVKRP